MVALVIVSLAGGYVLYTVWYSIVNDCFDAVILILAMVTLIALLLWYESVVNFHA